MVGDQAWNCNKGKCHYHYGVGYITTQCQYSKQFGYLLIITSGSFIADSSNNESNIPGTLIVGVVGGIFILLIIIAFFAVIIYLKRVQRRYPYASILDNSLQESKLHICTINIF